MALLILKKDLIADFDEVQARLSPDYRADDVLINDTDTHEPAHIAHMLLKLGYQADPRDLVAELNLLPFGVDHFYVSNIRPIIEEREGSVTTLLEKKITRDPTDIVEEFELYQ